MAYWLKKSFSTLVLVFLLSCSGNNSTTSNSDEKPTETVDRMEWWRDARFGMFIHWGVYSVPAGEYNGETVNGPSEWIIHHGKMPLEEYEKFPPQFNPQSFDADEWARLVKEAGMKYVVITSKHHDGFGMWDSKVSDYDVMDASPFKRDIIKELAEACKKHGIAFGVYYSILDWRHPLAKSVVYPMHRKTNDTIAPNFPKYFETYMKPQVTELVQQYDPAILWFDGEWISEYTRKMGLGLYDYLREMKPDLIINNRVDKERLHKEGMDIGDRDYVGDFGTPENEILENASADDWESCMTMNDSWGYKKNDNNWKSSELLIHNLIDIVTKGGNYLLNVGPQASGKIPQESVVRLQEMGKWLEVNGEAIYGTTRLNSFKQGDNIRFTKKKDSGDIYAILLSKPENQVVLETIIPDNDSEIKLLGYDKPLSYSYQNDRLIITFPESVFDEPQHYAWTIKISGKEKLLSNEE